MLTRTVTPTVPVTVTYEVTDLGRYPRPPALCRKTIDLCVPNNPICSEGGCEMAVFPNLLEIPTEYAHANSAGPSDQRAVHRICKSGRSL